MKMLFSFLSTKLELTNECSRDVISAEVINSYLGMRYEVRGADPGCDLPSCTGYRKERFTQCGGKCLMC
jgi:hypothetical protein